MREARKVNLASERWVKAVIEVLFYGGAVFIALLAGGLVMAAAGVSPLEAYRLIWDGAVGDAGSVKETLVKATPLLFAGLCYTFAYRCGLFNIGAEGQIYIGAMTGTMAALYVPGLPGYAHLPLCIVAGAVGGALWAGIAGALKIFKGASEIINTIMLNYVGIYLVSYMVTGPMKDPSGTLPQSARLPESALLAKLFDSRLHYGFVLAVVLAIILYVVLNRTVWGYEIRSVGFNKQATKVMGIPVNRNLLLVMLVSGAIAGIGGFVEIAGVQNRLFQNFSPGYGYDGIAVALVGGAHPLGNIGSAILFGGLRSGANAMQRMTGTSTSLVYVIQATIIVLVVCNRYWFGGWKRQLIAWLVNRYGSRRLPEELQTAHSASEVKISFNKGEEAR
ncbi:ABC transporter permease [Paenibacillus glycanilyticus]|uniref:ABC transporter permease n=1 Tax=Paenibacillus glycanilyticus TaxID=126569 RepID=A0ABQ6G8I6_9BACL|nr:ABC transporter permease [Paenibacillus glycanilyticus]GLX67274.1 ABC transporter permease [Paenibacillus glycanilyticus]